MSLTPSWFDLFLQISILCILVLSVALLRKKKMQLHGQTMVAAIFLNIVSFIAVMGPAWDNIGEVGSGLIGSIGMAHVAAGGLAFLLSFYVVGSWLLSTFFLQSATPPFLRCYAQKIPMWATLIFWVTSLALGIMLFLMVNTSLLGNFPLTLGN